MTIRPGDAGQQAADDVDQALDAVDRHAGQPRRRLVAADGQDLPAEHGAAEHDQAPAATTTSIRIDLERHAEDPAEADELEASVLEDLEIAVGHHLGDAAAGDEQDQRGDDRLDAVARDQPAVEPAEAAGDQHRQHEGERDAEIAPTAAGTSLPRKIIGASAPAIAISEPTDRSMPPVAITSVMPTPTMTMVQTWVRLTFSVCSVTKFGVKAMLKISRTTSATSVP